MMFLSLQKVRKGRKKAARVLKSNHMAFHCLSYFKLPCSSQKQCWKRCSKGWRSTSQQQHRLKRMGMIEKAGCMKG